MNYIYRYLDIHLISIKGVDIYYFQMFFIEFSGIISSYKCKEQWIRLQLIYTVRGNEVRDVKCLRTVEFIPKVQLTQSKPHYDHIIKIIKIFCAQFYAFGLSKLLVNEQWICHGDWYVVRGCRCSSIFGAVSLYLTVYRCCIWHFSNFCSFIPNLWIRKITYLHELRVRFCGPQAVHFPPSKLTAILVTFWRQSRGRFFDARVHTCIWVVWVVNCFYILHSISLFLSFLLSF